MSVGCYQGLNTYEWECGVRIKSSGYEKTVRDSLGGSLYVRSNHHKQLKRTAVKTGEAARGRSSNGSGQRVSFRGWKFSKAPAQFHVE